MNEEQKAAASSITSGILKAIAILAGVFFLLWFLYKIQAVILFIAIAAVISLIGRPIVLFLTRKFKFPNTLAVVSSMLFLVALFYGVLLMSIPLIADQLEYLQSLNLDVSNENMDRLYAEVAQFLSIEKQDVIETINNSGWLQYFSISNFTDYLNAFFNALGSIVIGVLSIFFIAFFLLKDSRILEESVLAFSHKENENRFYKTYNKIKELLSRYFIGIVFQLFVIFTLYSTFLLILSIENAIVIALICALFNIIPYVGPFIGGILMLSFTGTSLIDYDFQSVILPKLIYVFIGYLIVQLIDNFVNQPLIFSKSVRSHPLEIFLVILISGYLFGVLGMVIAVPGYTAIKVIAQEFLSEYKV
ncbi:MAG: AI-2E family transporter, partial [Flavobacteriaceae bacterium]|nr:AI-2E family transporter [Flavobacteriaceae bacterium]